MIWKRIIAARDIASSVRQFQVVDFVSSALRPRHNAIERREVGPEWVAAEEHEAAAEMAVVAIATSHSPA